MFKAVFWIQLSLRFLFKHLLHHFISYKVSQLNLTNCVHHPAFFFLFEWFAYNLSSVCENHIRLLYESRHFPLHLH